MPTISQPLSGPPPVDQSDITLCARELSFSYGAQPVLQNVTMEIKSGQVTAIVGPNGSGKSTLLHSLLGYLRPQAGEVLINERPLRSYSAADVAAAIALVPQTPAVAFAYTVEELVLMGRWPHRRRTKRLGATEPTTKYRAPGLPGVALRRTTKALAANKIFAQCKDFVGLWHEQPGAPGDGGAESDSAAVAQAMRDADVDHLAGRTFAELSGGERRRVTIARALAQDAPIVLLDEPLASLDLWHQLEMLHQMSDLAHRRGRAVCWVAHELNLARQFSDRVVLLDRGQVVVAGPASDVLVPPILEPIYRVRITVQGEQLSYARFPSSG